MNRVKFLLCFFLAIILIPKAKAAIATSYVDPDTVFAATITVEVIEHAGGVWAATGAGVNFTFDLGQTWLLYDISNGMLSDNLSAIFSQNNRLWVGANHSELVNESPTTFSDGLLYTDDLGDNWFQVDFGASGVDKLLGVNREVFDITGHYDASQNEDWLFFSAWAGALVASRDGGSSWRRIFPSIQDSIKYNNPDSLPELRMLNFSCVTDTSHGDTLFLWGGTAEGIFEYIFIPAHLKAFSPLINQIAFCDACTDSAGSFVFIGGNNGLTRGFKTGGPFVSRFQSDGLPGPQVTAVTDFRDRVIVGTANANGSSSTGLAYSDDRGDSFTPVSGFNSSYALAGNSNRIYDFAVIGERLYLAAEEAGLLVSLDSGLSWTQVLVDTLATLAQGNRRNVVYALNAEADTLRLGTDSGLVQLFMDPLGGVDSLLYYVFTEDANSSARVTKVRTQRFFTDTTLDSTAIWTVNQRTTIDGSPIVARSSDGGLSWDHLQIGQGVAELSHDVNFTGDTVYIVGTEGAKRIVSFSPGMFVTSLSIKDSVTSDDFDQDTLTTIEVHGDTIFIGTRNGFAIANARDSAVPPKFKITRINTDSLVANAVVQFQYDPANPLVAGVTGNFIRAMEIQYRGTDPAIVWSSCSPTASGQTNGIAAGAVVPVQLPDSSFIFERLWVSVYDEFAWNFAFNGDTVFVATDSGLVFTSDTGFSWDTMQFNDFAGEEIYDASRPVFGVEVIDGNLWVGGEDRMLKIDLSSFVSQGYFVVDTATAVEEVYAFPVPYSNVQHSGGDITFRFALEQDASVTIEVYDFAMNLVRRVIDNQLFAANFYPNLTARVDWDALNGQGHELAVGMYYFKVVLSTGETRWGKLAIIP